MRLLLRRKKRKEPCAVLLASVALLQLAAAAAAAAGTNPNVVLLVADDLGHNDLGYTNGKKTHTPLINAAVEAGIELTQCTPVASNRRRGCHSAAHPPLPLVGVSIGMERERQQK